MSHWSGLRPLASATASILGSYWDFSSLSCCCSVSWRSWSFGSAGLSTSCAPAVHKWGGCWDGSTHSPGLVLTHPAFLHPHYQGKLSSPALVSSPNAVGIKGWGQFTWSHALRVGSTPPPHHPPTGSALMCCLGTLPSVTLFLFFRKSSYPGKPLGTCQQVNLCWRYNGHSEVAFAKRHWLLAWDHQIKSRWKSDISTSICIYLLYCGSDSYLTLHNHDNHSRTVVY